MSMREVLRNQRLLGSTMGSRADLAAATAFAATHRLVPVVSAVLGDGDGLHAVEDGFRMLERGERFGKIVVRVAVEDGGLKERARL